MDQNKHKLTPGVIAKALNQSEDILNILEKESVVVQVLGTEIISSKDHKYRLRISDGDHLTTTVIFRPPQRSGQRDPPEDNSVVDIGKAQGYIQTLKADTSDIAWFIDSYKVLSSPRDVMGDPVTFIQSSSTPGPSTFKIPLPETPTKKPRLETENGEGATQIKFNLTKLSEIRDKKVDDSVDVMGVVIALGEEKSMFGRNDTKRDLTLRDNSGSSSGGSSVSVTLWDDKVKLCDRRVKVNSTILLILKAKVSDWQGKTLNAGSKASFFFDPNTNQAQSLSLWWRSCHHEGEEGHINTLSQESIP